MDPQRPRIINEVSDRKQYSEVDPVAAAIRGAVTIMLRDDDVLYPSRFSVMQMHEIAAVGHVYEAYSTAGMCVDVMAEGGWVALDYLVTSGLDPEDDHSVLMMDEVARRGLDWWSADVEPRVQEGCIVDGIAAVIGDGPDERVVAGVCTGGQARFELGEHEGPVRVRIYLPYWMGVGIERLESDGAWEPAENDGWMLVLGDSIVQGLFAGNPALTWAARAGRRLGLTLVNQAVSGHVYDARTLTGMKRIMANPPEACVVAYGTNDWCKRDDWDGILHDAHEYMARLATFLDPARVWVMTPFYRIDEPYAGGCGHKLDELRDILAGYAREFGFNVIDGREVLESKPHVFADLRLHPNAEAMGRVADVVVGRIESGK